MCGPCCRVLMSSTGLWTIYRVSVFKCILMGGDVCESVLLLQICVQVLYMLVSGSKGSKSWEDIILCTEDVRS